MKLQLPAQLIHRRIKRLLDLIWITESDINRKNLDFYIPVRWTNVKQHTGNTYHEAQQLRVLYLYGP